ncbi:MAG: hypothetical protein JXL97_07590 [Bacteroidales bacterium]|nr:hypothetical protein [Bacteroidales bacterium]
MKRTILFILGLSIVFFVASCKNETTDKDTDQEKTENIVSDENNNENVVENNTQENTNENVIKLKAEFNGIYLGSGGSGILFNGEDGKRYDFYDDGNDEVHEVFSDVEIGNPNDTKHYGEWYNITYKTTTIERYDGGTGKYYDDEVLVIVSIEPAN